MDVMLFMIFNRLKCLKRSNKGQKSYSIFNNELFNGSHCESLKSNGFVVIDNLFNVSKCLQFKKEIDLAGSQNRLFPNATHLIFNQTSINGEVTKKPVFITKKNISEVDFIEKPSAIDYPLFQSIYQDNSLLDNLATFFPEMQLKCQSIKGQKNEGHGGCFPIHSDSDAFLDSRQITCILYLNENWKPNDGGEIRLYPFPFSSVDIEPLGGRAVFFSSTNMLHRVLPSLTPRYCFTIWFSGDGKRAIDAQGVKKAENVNYQWEYLFHPKLRKHIARVIYSEEWVQSIKESHIPSEEVEILLAEHYKSVATIQKVLSPYLEIINKYFPLKSIEDEKAVPQFNPNVMQWF
jgi:Rps23 Pro-64 3,4-dihydroxylase Tpa1-like proline 4-hydroxylase